MEFNMFLFPKPNHKEENIKIYENNIIMIPKNLFVKKIKFSKKKFGNLNDSNSKYYSITNKEDILNKNNNTFSNKNKNLLKFNFDIDIIKRKEPKVNIFKPNMDSKKKNNNNNNGIKNEILSIQIPKTDNSIRDISSYNSNCNSPVRDKSLKKNLNEYNMIKTKNYKKLKIFKNTGAYFNNEKIKLDYEINFMNYLKKKNKDNQNYNSNSSLNKYFNNFKEKFKKKLFNSEDLFPILLFTPYEFGMGNSNDVILFFHGNGEDMFACSKIAKKLCFNWKINVIIMEYPGYSIYKGSSEEKAILKNSLHIYDYLKSIHVDKIILVGRSIGTGPSCYLARFREIHSIILISPFTSIKDVIKSHAGNFLSLMIKQRFNNLKRIRKIKNPILLVHGHKDSLIPILHSKQLKKEYEKSKFNVNIRKLIYLKEFKNMTHNIYDSDLIIVNPIIQFFNNLKNLNIY